jgi:26S proteasome regulatory subunit N10
VINFGTENTTNDNTEKLEQLIAAVNSSDNSHLVSIPPGPHIFADMVLMSPIMQSGGGGGGSIAGVPSGGGAPSGGAPHVGGIDPNMDPEMAMAIRMSMEEERQRQQKASGETAGGTAPAPAAAAGGGGAPVRIQYVPSESNCGCR